MTDTWQYWQHLTYYCQLQYGTTALCKVQSFPARFRKGKETRKENEEKRKSCFNLNKYVTSIFFSGFFPREEVGQKSCRFFSSYLSGLFYLLATEVLLLS